MTTSSLKLLSPLARTHTVDRSFIRDTIVPRVTIRALNIKEAASRDANEASVSEHHPDCITETKSNNVSREREREREIRAQEKRQGTEKRR